MIKTMLCAVGVLCAARAEWAFAEPQSAPFATTTASSARTIAAGDMTKIISSCDQSVAARYAGRPLSLDEATMLATTVFYGSPRWSGADFVCSENQLAGVVALKMIVGDPILPDAPVLAISTLIEISYGDVDRGPPRWVTQAIADTYRASLLRHMVLLEPRDRVGDRVEPLDASTVAFLDAAARVNGSGMPNIFLAQQILLTDPGHMGQERALALLEVPKVQGDPMLGGTRLRAQILSGGVRGTAGLKTAFEFYRAGSVYGQLSPADRKAAAAIYAARDAIAGGDALTAIRVCALAAARAEPDIAAPARADMMDRVQALNGGTILPPLIMGKGVTTRKPCTVSSDDYPSAALRNEDQGLVAVQVLVDSAGLPLFADVVYSSGSAVLDDATVRLVMRRTAAGFVLPSERAGTYSWVRMPPINWAIPR